MNKIAFLTMVGMIVGVPIIIDVYSETLILDAFAYTPGTRISYDLINDTIECSSINPDVADPDIDKDGVCDVWESTGNELIITDPDNPSIEYIFDCNQHSNPNNTHPQRCDNNMKDIFIELDWMEGHMPDPGAIDLVVDAFYNANIRLHVQVDSHQSITHDDPTIPFPGFQYDCCPEYAGFDQIKGEYFGIDAERNEGDIWYDHKRKLKSQVFHYGLFVHEREWAGNSSGIGEILGDDLLVSLGWATNEVGSLDQQAGTLMHELGHNLGLHHGGGINDATPQCKPNHFSVMSYSRQFTDYDANRKIDFSGQSLGYANTDKLVEDDLNENGGMETYVGHEDEKVIYSCLGAPSLVARADETSIDWNCDGIISEKAEENINNFSLCSDFSKTDLVGHHDWNNINMYFRNNSNFQSGWHYVAGGVGTIGHPNDDYRIPPGTTLEPDDGIVMEYFGNEMTLQDITLQRIDTLLSLYRDLYAIPEDRYVSFSFADLPENFKTSNDGKRLFSSEFSTKDAALESVKIIIDSINHHDLKKARNEINIIKEFGPKILPADYSRLDNTINNFKGIMDSSLNYSKTDIHNTEHKPQLEQIIEQQIINNKINNVKQQVQSTPTYIPPTTVHPIWQWILDHIILPILQLVSNTIFSA